MNNHADFSPVAAGHDSRSEGQIEIAPLDGEDLGHHSSGQMEDQPQTNDSGGLLGEFLIRGRANVVDPAPNVMDGGTAMGDGVAHDPTSSLEHCRPMMMGQVLLESFFLDMMAC